LVIREVQIQAHAAIFNPDLIVSPRLANILQAFTVAPNFESAIFQLITFTTYLSPIYATV